MEQVGKLRQWVEARKQMEYWKAAEVELRRSICLDILDGDFSERTVKAEYDGVPVKVSQRSTRSIDQAALSTLWPELEEEAKNCIDFKPSLKLANYRKLSQDSLLHEAITEKPSPTPTLEVSDAY